MNEEKQRCAALLRSNLARARELRLAAAATPDDSADRVRLRAWQAQRLARTHADLLASPRYRATAQFFLDDLYGPKDFSRRDEEVERILPTLTRLLPASALHTLAGAIGLDALSEELDRALVARLRAARRIDSLDDVAYAAAYRACANRSQREAQIDLIREVGSALAQLTRTPLLAGILRAMRGPAHLAGLQELHDFLEQGFAAFRHMGRADEFLALIVERETALMQRLFAAPQA